MIRRVESIAEAEVAVVDPGSTDANIQVGASNPASEPRLRNKKCVCEKYIKKLRPTYIRAYFSWLGGMVQPIKLSTMPDNAYLDYVREWFNPRIWEYLKNKAILPDIFCLEISQLLLFAPY